MLKGKQFFAWEILPALQAANTVACARFTSSLDYETPPVDQAVWRKACGDTAALMVTAQSQSAADQNLPDPPAYKEISSLWQQVDGALLPFENEPSVVAAVDALADDGGALPGPSWTAPALAIGGLLGALAFGYWWSKR
jgi:hypothetical protein